MKRLIALTLATCATVASAADYPGSYTAAQLLEQCSGPKADAKLCSAFIAGVRSGAAAQRLYMRLELSRPEYKEKGNILQWLLGHEPFCSRTDITDANLVDAFVQMAKQAQKDSPALLDGGAGFTVLAGANHKYPCN